MYLSNFGEVMDEAAIEVRANRLNDLIHRIIVKDNPKFYSEIEVALTAARDAGRDERGEEDARIVAAIGRSISADVRRWGSFSRVTSTHVGEFFARAVKEIRRLSKKERK